MWAASCAPAAKVARAGCAFAGAAHKNSPLVLFCGCFLVSASPVLRDEARRVEAQHRFPVRGGALSLVLIVQATAEEVKREIANRDLNPGCVGAMY